MAWVYLDDGIPTHPKVVAAGGAHELAPWLFVCGLAYCRRHLTAGLIPAPIVPTLTPLYRRAAVGALVRAGLWEEVGPPGLPPGAYLVHDYEEWNAAEDGQRQARVEKARKAGLASAAARRAAAQANPS